MWAERKTRTSDGSRLRVKHLLRGSGPSAVLPCYNTWIRMSDVLMALESRVKRLEVLQGGVMANTSERGMWQKSSRSIARSVRETRPPQRTWPCTTAQTVNRPARYIQARA